MKYDYDWFVQAQGILFSHSRMKKKSLKYLLCQIVMWYLHREIKFSCTRRQFHALFLLFLVALIAS